MEQQEEKTGLDQQENKKADIFCQVCNSIGFHINQTQASLLLDLVELINEKEEKITFEDINKIALNYSNEENRE